MAHSVTLTWTAPVGALPGDTFSIFRGTASGKENAAPIATGVTGTSYTDGDPTLVEGTDYFYLIETVRSGLTSTASNEANAIIPLVVTTPNPPTGLKALAV
jgi:hypothetical protein